MTTTSQKDWSDYYKNTREYPPSPLVVRALTYVTERTKAAQNRTAIDIGGGTLKDTRYLLSKGFEVTVIDQSPQLTQFARECNSDKLHCHVTRFADFKFKPGTYDLAVAMFSLPFNAPAEFDDVFARIKKSLVSGGIFAGNFFGPRDDWHERTTMTFFAEQQVKALLADMETIVFVEREFDGKTAAGDPKHWHVFDVIARKN